MLSCPETVRNASRPKKSCAKSTLPSGVRGRFARSRLDTRNNAPALSASEPVMIGVLTQKNPCLSTEARSGLGDSNGDDLTALKSSADERQEHAEHYEAC